MGNITNKRLKAAERMHAELLARNIRPEGRTERNIYAREVLTVTKNEVKETLNRVTIWRAAGDDGISVGHVNNGRYIVLEKLAK